MVGQVLLRPEPVDKPEHLHLSNARKLSNQRGTPHNPISETDLLRVFSQEFLLDNEKKNIPERMELACYIASHIQIHNKEVIETVVDYVHSSKQSYLFEAFNSIGIDVFPILINLAKNESDQEIRTQIIKTFYNSRYWAAKARNTIESILLEEEKERDVKYEALMILEYIHDERSLAIIEQYVEKNINKATFHDDTFVREELRDVWEVLYRWGGDAGLSVLLSFIKKGFVPYTYSSISSKEYHLPNPKSYSEYQVFSDKKVNLFVPNVSLSPYFHVYRPIIVSETTYSQFNSLYSNSGLDTQIHKWLELVLPYIISCPDDLFHFPILEHYQKMSHKFFFFEWDSFSRINFYCFLILNSESFQNGRLEIFFGNL